MKNGVPFLLENSNFDDVGIWEKFLLKIWGNPCPEFPKRATLSKIIDFCFPNNPLLPILYVLILFKKSVQANVSGEMLKVFQSRYIYLSFSFWKGIAQHFIFTNSPTIYIAFSQIAEACLIFFSFFEMKL